ncbi:MAG: SYNERG-CTERM sorting domain-containing protein, partial [Fretibacterium sp.]|nr:SYNERG-CTERM sorting domain-containing protein [Fretibacterium sp.]
SGSGGTSGGTGGGSGGTSGGTGGDSGSGGSSGGTGGGSGNTGGNGGNGGNSNTGNPDDTGEAVSEDIAPDVDPLPDVTGPDAEQVPAAAAKEEVKDSPVTQKTVAEALGADMGEIELVPMASVDQTDTRTEEQKTEVANRAVESRGGDAGRTVTFVLVLHPMRPKKTGIHTFHLPIPDNMKTGDFLVWFSGEKPKTDGASVSVAAGPEPGGTVFIDEATGRKTDVVPESRSVTVAAYLNADREYEPVILTEKPSGDGDDNPDSPTSNKDSGGGCDAGFGGMALLALLGLIATKKH